MAGMDPAVLLAPVRARLRRTVVLGGTARLAGVLIASAGAAVLADYLWFLPGWLRLAVLALIVGGAGLIAWRRLIRPLRTPLPDHELAVFVERRTPALQGRLITAVAGIPLDETASAACSAAMPAPAALVPARQLPRLLGLAGVALAAGLAIAVAAPWFWRDGLLRLALPLADHDWQRATAFTAHPERAVVAADEPAVIVVERTHGGSGAARIAWDDGQGNGGARQLPGTSGPWRQALTLPLGNWRVSVSGGDAHPTTTRVLVVERPRLIAAETRLTPPAYSHLPERDQASPAGQVLAGSTLALRLRLAAAPGRALAQVSATFAGKPLALRAAGDAWLGNLAIHEAGELVVEAVDGDSIAIRPAARFPIAVEPDRAPSVSLAGPRGDEAVGPRAKVQVAVEAGDDFGLARVGLTAAPAAPGAAASEPRSLHAEELDGRRSLTRRLVVDVATLTGPGGSITLVGKAEDANDITGPGVGVSSPLVLKVVAEDELRRELERQLGEARDRVHQARTALAPALADPAKLPTAARAAAQDATRAAELLARVERRWAENSLEAERIAPAAEARQAAGEEASAPLGKAAGGDQAAARAGDAALDKAERALDRMLSDSDLTRIVALLLERQKALAEETRPFVREHLTREPDEAGKTRQADLAARQKELSARAADAERRILSGPASLDPAKAVVRNETPAERMEQASGSIASADRRARTPEQQQSAIAALTRLLDALRGGDAAADLARRAGELAERQERLADAIAEGLDRESAQREQQRLREDTERLANDLQREPEAAKSAAAAAGAQQGAESALQQGERAAAARDAGTAAELLRQAQRALDPQQQEKEKQENEKSQPDVIALLRALFTDQARILADSLPVDKRMGEDEPDFAARRDLATIAQLQDDVLLRLREEGVKALDQAPIALVAVKRVEAAMDRVLTQLRTPALGARGLALERIALAELKRVIDIAASTQNSKGGEGDGGQGGGGGNQAPFPPAAEIALLIARQTEIHALTAAGRPADLGAMQSELAKLVGLVESATRPGSRPQVLVARARRSAEGAAGFLAARDRGVTARHHMLASEEALRQVLAEAKGSGGGSGSKPPPPQPNGAPPSPSPGGGAAPGAAAAGGAVAAETRVEAAVRAEQERTALLQLPPERREQLRQAREQRLPAGALQLFERYLEKLEER